MIRVVLLIICMISVAQARQFDSVLRELGVDRQPIHATKSAESFYVKQGYLFRNITLVHQKFGHLLVSMRIPNGHSNRPRPVIFMSTGFHAGAKTTQLIGDVGDNILVSFDYGLVGLRKHIEKINTLSGKFEKSKTQHNKNLLVTSVKGLARALPGYIDTIKTIPLQISAALGWLVEQREVDRLRINLVGVSMGTQVLPLAQRIFEYHGGQVASSVWGYGGADVSLIVEDVLNEHLGNIERKITRQLIQVLMNGYDSKDHLSHLNSSNYLIVNGLDEDIFSNSSVMTLTRLTPKPKKVVWLKGAHINSDSDKLIERFIDTVLNWGISTGSIN